MNESALIAALAEACAAAGDAAANSQTNLVSASFERLGTGMPPFAIETRIVRATRTLVFLEADARGADGARVMSASMVRKTRA